MQQIKLYGTGGQGVVTAAKIIAQAVAIHEGRYARSLPAYGHERRGAPVHADVMLSDEEILLSTFVYHPDLVLVFDQSVIQKGIHIQQGTHPGSILVINTKSAGEFTTLQAAGGWKQVYRLDATSIALRLLGRNIPNTAMLGALARTGIVQLASIQNAILVLFGRKAGELNARVAEEGFRSVVH